MALPIELYVRLIIGIFAIPPIVVLLQYYKKSQVREFLIFAMFFFFGAVHHLYFYIVYLHPTLINFQIWYLLSHLSFAFLLLHNVQVMRKNLRKEILGIGAVWFIIILVTQLFWKLGPQPDRFVLGPINLPTTYSDFHPNGAGFIINGVVIYSTSHRLLSLLFYTYVCIVSIYAYYSADIHENDELYRYRLIWIAAFIANE